MEWSGDALTALVVEVHVRALFVIITGDLWLFMSLKPSHILLVKAPRLLLQLLGSKELLIASLLMVESEEKGVCRQTLE